VPHRLARAASALALLLACAAAPSPLPVRSAGPAASPEPAAPAGESTLSGPFYRVETDTIVSQRNGDFEMPHKVAFSRPGSDGTADSATGNDKRGTITMRGNVVLHDNGAAPEASGASDDYAKGGPATLTCDTLNVDSKKKIYIATGHVHFVQGKRVAVADKGTLDRSTGTLRLEGNVKTSENGSTMTAAVMDYNTNTKKIDANGKPIIIKQPVPPPEPGSGSPTPKPKKRRLPFP
jgi:lipopolysaccharide export system protein LptA